ncbi:hypothetical protein TELCIR_17311 [Teladorsagia circumcincta]|uniref:Uncharacterized protein n=1 Tax=Teladorsagia circumcincta TaxID=45464 RepID=A0A2G9TT61_TELCI|nr:hypothetical protein TELCIR_17311 [Teladorsagia circumcincta]
MPRLRQVIGNEFLVDPCSIGHECRPGKYVEEKGNRIFYKKLQSVRKDPEYAKKKPSEIFKELVTGHYDADNEDMEDEIRDAIRRPGYKYRRRTILNSVKKCRRSLAVTEKVSSEKCPEIQEL